MSTFINELDFEDPAACAMFVKNTLSRNLSTIYGETDMNKCFIKPQNVNKKIVYYTEISQTADKEMKKWLKVPDFLTYSNNFEDKISKWISEISISDLENIMSSFSTFFTPWQRLFIYYVCKHPISYSVSLTAGAQVLNQKRDDYVGYQSSKKRKIDISAAFSSFENVTQTINILPIGTAGGKTSMSISIGNYLITTGFEDLKRQYISRCAGIPFSGFGEPEVVPLVLVCSFGGVHNHWINECNRLMNDFMNICPGVHYNIWDGQGKDKSIEDALNNYKENGTVTFWFLQIQKMNEELRKNPYIAVAVMITDEMTVDTPREKTKTNKSPVCVNLLPQATPQALVESTRGCTSWLKEAFNGEMTSINYISRYIDHGRYKEAQNVAEQYCKLMQFMPMFFREQIRFDLQNMVPVGMNILHIKSKRGTLASHLMDSTADIVPASFQNVLKSNIPYHQFDYETCGLKDLDCLLKTSTSIKIEEILDRLKEIKSRANVALSSIPSVSRMISRMQDFCEECPICWSKSESPRMMTCCSYCVCSTCFNNINRCAFCREEINDHVEVQTEHEVENEFLTQCDLEGTIFFNTNNSNLQMKNLGLVLKSMSEHDYKRILLMTDIYSLTREATNKFISNIYEKFGFHVYNTENATNGKGTSFKFIKENFDSIEKHSEPIILLCNNHHHSNVLVGVDFKYADAMIVVGDVVPRLATQLVGRVFRPLKERDNNKFIPFVRIYC